MPQTLWRLLASGPKLGDKTCSADRRPLKAGQSSKSLEMILEIFKTESTCREARCCMCNYQQTLAVDPYQTPVDFVSLSLSAPYAIFSAGDNACWRI